MYDNEDEGLLEITDGIDLFFNILFGVESAIKIIAYGMILNRNT